MIIRNEIKLINTWNAIFKTELYKFYKDINETDMNKIEFT